MIGYPRTKAPPIVDGTALASSTTPTSLLTASGIAKPSFDASCFDQVGNLLLVKAAGRISTLVTSPGTLTLDLRFGSVVIANGGTMVLSTTAKTNVAWEMEMLLTLRTIGSNPNAAFMFQGRFTSEAAGATTVAGEAKSVMLPQSAPAVGTSFDNAATQTLDIFGTWSVNNAANSILLHQFMAQWVS